MASEIPKGEYEEVFTDAIGQEFVRGPSDRQVALVREAIREVGARWIGFVLASDGVGEEGMLGMLDDETFGLDEAVECLVMHGELDDDRMEEQPPYDPGRDESVLIIHLSRENRQWQQFPDEQVIEVPVIDKSQTTGIASGAQRELSPGATAVD